MSRITKDPLHVELTSILAKLHSENHDITARAVAKLHPTLKQASDFTRHAGRRALIEQYQENQREFRSIFGRVRSTGSTIAAQRLQEANLKIEEFERNEAARIESHVAMIQAMAELGGITKLLKFYQKFAYIRETLEKQGALPELNENVVKLPSKKGKS